MRRIRTDGFTLLELLVSMAIIAVLAGVALPNLSEARKRSRDVPATAYARNLAAWIATADASSTSGLTDCLDPVLVAQGAPAAMPVSVSACSIASDPAGHLVITVRSVNDRDFVVRY